MYLVLDPQPRSEGEMERIAVICLGNILRGDDGLGVYLKSILENRFEHFDFIDGGICGSRIIDILSRYRKVIIIDSSDFGGEIGEVREFNLDEIRERDIFSVHFLNLGRLIELSRLLYNRPEDVTILCVQVENMSFGQGLSSSVEKNLDNIVEKIEKFLLEIAQPTVH